MVKDKERVMAMLTDISSGLVRPIEMYSERIEPPWFLSGESCQTTRIWYLFPSGNVRITVRENKKNFPIKIEHEERVISIYQCVDEFSKTPFGIDNLVKSIEDRYNPNIPLYLW